MHRFFVPSANATGSVAALPDEEAAQLRRVLRLKSGDRVRVFDGRGHEWYATVHEVERQQVTVRLGEPTTSATEPRIAITLAAAVLKGDKMDDVVRDAVMLGVAAIVPLVTERSEVAASVIARGGRIGRWQRIAVASAKQCGRALVPDVHGGIEFGEAMRGLTGLRLLLTEPQAHASGVMNLREIPRAAGVVLFVGPEGGWSPGEIETAVVAGAKLATLGQQTFRADAAPLIAITALRVLWDDL